MYICVSLIQIILDMENSKQHVQVPNSMTVNQELTPKDLLIYATIKRYMNSKTKEAFPSGDTIAQVSGVTKPTIKKCVDKLVELGYLTVFKKGRSNIYRFSPYKNFEPFSYDFLDKEGLSANEKAYLIASQQFMFKDMDGYGKITLQDKQMSKILNISHNSVSKYNKSLEEKGYLSIINTSAKDVHGNPVHEKLFNLTELEQQIVFVLGNHEDRLTKLENQNENLMASLKEQNELLKRQLKILLEEKQDDRKRKDEECIIIL